MRDLAKERLEFEHARKVYIERLVDVQLVLFQTQGILDILSGEKPEYEDLREVAGDHLQTIAKKLQQRFPYLQNKVLEAKAIVTEIANRPNPYDEN